MELDEEEIEATKRINEKKQCSRNEIKERTRNILQEKYNNLYKDYIELKSKYEKLVNVAIEISFEEYNYHTELLLRILYKQGLVGRTETHYYKLGGKK